MPGVGEKKGPGTPSTRSLSTTQHAKRRSASRAYVVDAPATISTTGPGSPLRDGRLGNVHGHPSARKFGEGNDCAPDPGARLETHEMAPSPLQQAGKERTRTRLSQSEVLVNA